MDKRIFDEMIETRRSIHKRPELGWTEFETTYLIVSRLQEIGYTKILVGKSIIDTNNVLGRDEVEVQKAIDRAIAHGVPADFIDSIDRFTGAVAVLETGRPGKNTALRFDIDALPIQETADPAHEANRGGFRSERAGIMHACGHDGHTALGLAVARWLFENKDRMNGTIKLLFQPAEEGVRGAAAIAASGLFDDVDYILAGHCGGMAKLGETTINHNSSLPTTKLDIEFTGTASHAATGPEKGRSALMAACATAMMMAGIPRHSSGATRVCVGKLNAGEGRNVTPVHAKMLCEVRGMPADVNEYMERQVENIVKGNAQAYGVDYRITCAGRATTMPVCPEVQDICRTIMQGMPEVKKIIEVKQLRGSEDFTNLATRVVEKGGQAGMFCWGCTSNGAHKPDFSLQDTESMPIGFQVFTRFLEKVNSIDA